MSTLPPELSAPISWTENAVAEAWWEALSTDDRTELTALFDPRQDDCFFGADAADDGEPPTVRGGRFVPHDDAWGYEEWGPEWFDHLLAHPEVMEVWKVRTFHICTRHPVARAALAAGRIPSDFACPFAAADCPTRRLIDASPTGSVRFAGVVMNDGTRRVIALPMV